MFLSSAGRRGKNHFAGRPLCIFALCAPLMILSLSFGRLTSKSPRPRGIRMRSVSKEEREGGIREQPCDRFPTSQYKPTEGQTHITRGEKCARVCTVVRTSGVSYPRNHSEINHFSLPQIVANVEVPHNASDLCAQFLTLLSPFSF